MDVTYFDPQPDTLPPTFASPFDHAEPHPLARRAADELIARVRGWASLDAPGGGKMFGVLVVAAPDGRIGYLRGFSGMLDGEWQVAGFVPPPRTGARATAAPTRTCSTSTFRSMNGPKRKARKKASNLPKPIA
jgi:hypothetical protein